MQLVDHMEGSHTTIRQRCLYPHTAHTWDRSLHHDGVAKLDTVHSGGRIEASKIISVVSEDALELLHKPRVTTENLRVRICPSLKLLCSANYFIIEIIRWHLRPTAVIFRMSAPRLRPFTETTVNYRVLMIMHASIFQQHC